MFYIYALFAGVFQYVVSKSCVTEFRYSLINRHIPVILAVVGTGSEWLQSEVRVSMATWSILKTFNLFASKRITKIIISRKI